MSITNLTVNNVNLDACRICLKTTGLETETVSLNKNEKWKIMFELCVGISFADDDIPQLICQECVAHLEQFAIFKRKCLESYEFWKSRHIAQAHSPQIQTTESLDEIKYELKEDSIDFDNHSIENSNLPNQEHEETDCGSDTDSLQTEIKKENAHIEAIKCNKPESNNHLENKKKQVKVNKKKKYDNLFYCCIECNIEFGKNRLLTRHMKTKHKTQYMKSILPILKTEYCGLCQFTSSNFDEMKSHIVQEHVSKGDLKCKLCEFSGRDFADMEPHRYDHFPKGFKLLIKCHACRKNLRSSLSLQFHYRSVHLKKPGGLCIYCGEVIHVRRAFVTHVKMHKEAAQYICDLCGRNYMHKSGIIAHLADHSDIRQFVCDACGNRYKRMATLKMHIETNHRLPNPVKCKECNKIFKHNILLNRHVRDYHRETKFTCDVCSKQYVLLKQLKKHMFWHTDEKPFKCDICGIRYKAKGQLNIHIRKHTGVRPFECTYCEKCFPASNQLKRHLNIHTGSRNWQCRYCEKNFDYRERLVKHCMSNHKDKDHSWIREGRINKLVKIS